jgi:hypothetical protein
MKSLLRASILIFAASAFLPPARGQDASSINAPPAPQGQFQGALASHGVRGTVTAVSGDNITVKTEAGDTYKIETGPNTRFRKQRDRSQGQSQGAGSDAAMPAQIKISDIHVGDMIVAGGDKDDKAKTVGAAVVMVFDKEQYEKARADFGKTWTAGTIQSIDETKITVKRPDNVVQTIVVDENTSFRKRRDSITLADIKVGDNVTAQGSLQNGNFLATVFTLGGPGRQGGPGGERGGSGGYGGGAGGHGQAASAPATGTNPAPPNQ